MFRVGVLLMRKAEENKNLLFIIYLKATNLNDDKWNESFQSTTASK